MAGSIWAGARLLLNNLRRTFVRDLVLPARIGVYPHEQGAAQRIRVNVDAWCDDDPATDGVDRLDRVLNYERLRDAVHRVVGEGHVKLVETLAERIAAGCMLDRVCRVRVRVEKLDVFADATSAGVEIDRLSTNGKEP